MGKKQRLARLRSGRVVLGLLSVLIAMWNLADRKDTLQSIPDTADDIWGFAQSDLGMVALFVAGVLWLTYVILQPGWVPRVIHRVLVGARPEQSATDLIDAHSALTERMDALEKSVGGAHAGTSVNPDEILAQVQTTYKKTHFRLGHLQPQLAWEFEWLNTSRIPLTLTGNVRGHFQYPPTGEFVRSHWEVELEGRIEPMGKARKVVVLWIADTHFVETLAFYAGESVSFGFANMEVEVAWPMQENEAPSPIGWKVVDTEARDIQIPPLEALARLAPQRGLVDEMGRLGPMVEGMQRKVNTMWHERLDLDSGS